MTTDSLLTRLVPSIPFLLAYSLPLLLISILLTLAGAFLTLDRTRSFPSSYDVIPGAWEAKKRTCYSPEGGIGGMVLGFAFGVHLSTFLSLLIPAVTSSTALSPASFLAVWILSATLIGIIGGRWKYCALTIAGVSGGALIALSLSVIVHPPLITRVIMTIILSLTLTCLSLVPFDRFQHACLRIATSSTGAFGVILSIALLAHIPAWANVWERWWLSDKPEWGSRKERGLSAGFCLIFIAGLTCDWILHWKFGACPDQKWDHYLSAYAVNLPDRPGTFRPLLSFWGRLFRGNQLPLPSDTSSKGLRFATPTKQGQAHRRTNIQTELGKRRENVKFRSFSDLNSACSSDSEESILDANSRSSAKAESDQMKWKLPSDYTQSNKTPDDGVTHDKPANSNVETSLPNTQDLNIHGDNHRNDEEKYTYGYNPSDVPDLLCSTNELPSSDSLPQRTAALPIRSPLPNSPPFGTVPATPSLIRALDRITSAQQVAFRNLATSESADTLPPHRETIGTGITGRPRRLKNLYYGFEWDSFWKDIKAKAIHNQNDA